MKVTVDSLAGFIRSQICKLIGIFKTLAYRSYTTKIFKDLVYISLDLKNLQQFKIKQTGAWNIGVKILTFAVKSEYLL